MKHKIKAHPHYVVAGGQILAGGKSRADLERYAELHDDKSRPKHERPQVFSGDFMREVMNVDPTEPSAWRDPPTQRKSRTHYFPVVSVPVNRSMQLHGQIYLVGKASTQRQAEKVASNYAQENGRLRTGQPCALSLIPSIVGGKAWAFTYWA